MRPAGGNFVAAASGKQEKQGMQGAMIAPYDPHGCSAVVSAGGGGVIFRDAGEKRVSVISKSWADGRGRGGCRYGSFGNSSCHAE